jgi:hypothetical protein
MNYQRIYDQIIDRAQAEDRKKSGKTYYENHHIVPKCLGGSNEKNNLVLLTGREHFLAHWTLTRVHPDNAKLVFAFWAMCNIRSAVQKERHIPSSRAYQEAKGANSTAYSITRKAFEQTEEGRASKKGAIAKVDYAARTANTDYKARVANTDYDALQKKRVASMDWDAKAQKCMKTILQLDKDGTFSKEWPSVKKAGEALGIYRGSISSCLTGKLRSAGGFNWQYKNK